MIARIIATCGGLGLSPMAPGTAGSFGGAIACYGLRIAGCSDAILWLLGIFFFVAGWWATHAVTRNSMQHDPSWVVIDEWAALWVALMLQPLTWQSFILTTVLFRIFDIYKPWPVNVAEKLPGAWGVMADDAVAAMMTIAIMAAYRLL